jgi:putative transposase
MISNWKEFLRLSTDDELKNLQQHERTGRPLGNGSFVEEMEQKIGRILRPQRPGPKKKSDS